MAVEQQAIVRIAYTKHLENRLVELRRIIEEAIKVSLFSDAQIPLSDPKVKFPLCVIEPDEYRPTKPTIGGSRWLLSGKATIYLFVAGNDREKLRKHAVDVADGLTKQFSNNAKGDAGAVGQTGKYLQNVGFWHTSTFAVMILRHAKIARPAENLVRLVLCRFTFEDYANV